MSIFYSVRIVCWVSVSMVLISCGESSVMNWKGTSLSRAIVGAGCFWCVEAVYERIEGVEDVVSGFAKGEGLTERERQRIEVVMVLYDSSIVSYADLLSVFWMSHDPTTPDRQGPDVGPQYRSAIFYENEGQRLLAERSMVEARTQFPDPIVTEILPLASFSEASNDHQDYYRANPDAPYCRLIILPKLKKLGLRSGVTVPAASLQKDDER